MTPGLLTPAVVSATMPAIIPTAGHNNFGIAGQKKRQSVRLTLRGAPAPTRTETPGWAQALNLPRMPIPPRGRT